MSTILEKLIKNSKSSDTTTLGKSIFYKDKEVCPTSVPMVNVALGGSVDSGLTSGLTILAGPSRHFKTSFALLIASAYLKKHEDAAILFYDSEFGSPQDYFESFGIDVDRVIHTPVKSIEDLKFDLVGQLEGLDRKDKVIIIIDSLGNIASKKELEDAINEKSVADMTRAKSLKGLFRMVTPYLTMKDIPLLGINHTYQTQEMFSKAVVSGGTGIMYSADTVWIIGRRQDKDGTEIQGYHFVINIEKSRFVKEKSKIPVSVSWKGGIQKWSGLLDVAVEAGYVVKPKNGWYIAVDPAKYVAEVKDPKTKKVITEAQGTLTKSMREKDTMSADFWNTVFTETDFKKHIENHFSVGHIAMLTDPEGVSMDDEETEED